VRVIWRDLAVVRAGEDFEFDEYHAPGPQ
jgi:hypothetical protein